MTDLSRYLPEGGGQEGRTKGGRRGGQKRKDRRKEGDRMEQEGRTEERGQKRKGGQRQEGKTEGQNCCVSFHRTPFLIKMSCEP